MKKTKAKYLRLDPRINIILIMLSNLLIFSYGDSLYVNIAIGFALLLLLLSGMFASVIKIVVFYALILLSVKCSVYLSTSLQNLVGFIVLPIVMFFPVFLFSFYFFSTLNISKLIGGLQKWKVPQTIIIPIVVMCRFFPTIRLELINIRNAMKLKSSKFNIIKIIEFVYVPLLFSSVKIAEELTISALTRGLGLYKTTTIVVDTKIKIFDIFCIMVLLALLFLSRGWLNV